LERRTRIVATLGPATDRPGVLESILEAGLDVARINFSHGSAEDHRRRVNRVRELTDRRARPLAILGDLPGPKLRAILGEPLPLLVGQLVTLARSRQVSAHVTLTEPEVLDMVAVGHRVLLDDGRLQLRVQEIQPDLVTLKVLVGGVLQPNKGVNLPDSPVTVPALTPRDRDALDVAAAIGVDWLALSFVRAPSAADEVRASARACGLTVPIMAKIERPEAVEQAREIIAAFDGIMVARGDLGVEIPLEQVPHVQKRLITEARAAGKPVITATDMLDSMRHNPRPTRAEASDVANAVYDGTDALMLSGETSVGDNPVEAVQCMARIACETERNLDCDQWRDVYVPRGEIHDHMTHLTWELAKALNADAIIAPTYSGRTARHVARHRPGVAVIAPTPDDAILRQLALTWGLLPVPLPPHLDAGADRLEAAVHAAFERGAVRPGALVIVLAGHPLEGGEGLPTVRVARVGADGKSHAP
jgi:pyruvate kinase